MFGDRGNPGSELQTVYNSIMQALKSFEASLQGVLPSSDLEPVLQRCSLLCSASSLGRFHWREILFEADRTHANSATFALNPANMRSLDMKIACRRDAEVTKDSELPWRVRNTLSACPISTSDQLGHFMRISLNQRCPNGP